MWGMRIARLLFVSALLGVGTAAAGYGVADWEFWAICILGNFAFAAINRA